MDRLPKALLANEVVLRAGRWAAPLRVAAVGSMAVLELHLTEGEVPVAKRVVLAVEACARLRSALLAAPAGSRGRLSRSPPPRPQKMAVPSALSPTLA